MFATLAASKLLILPPCTGRFLDRGIQHPGQLEVGAVDLLAGQLIEGVEPLERLAGDLPVLRILELDVFRRLDLGGGQGHLAVGGGAAGGRVREHAVGRRHLGDRDLPFVGRGLLEHLARRGAALPHVQVRGADATAAAGREVAPYPLAGDALAGRRIFPGDFRPVGFELLGDQLGETGERALAHLGAGDADDDGVVRADHHPGIDFRRAVLREDDLRAAERNVEADGEPAAGGGCADDEGAAIYFWHVVHGCLPHHALAAAWIASRTCWKVPQRQILVMVASMSASVGFGLSLSSAATAMIIPHWQ